MDSIEGWYSLDRLKTVFLREVLSGPGIFIPNVWEDSLILIQLLVYEFCLVEYDYFQWCITLFKL